MAESEKLQDRIAEKRAAGVKSFLETSRINTALLAGVCPSCVVGDVRETTSFIRQMFSSKRHFLCSWCGARHIFNWPDDE